MARRALSQLGSADQGGASDAIGSQGHDVTANYGRGEPEILRCCPLQSSILSLGGSVRKTLLRFLLLVSLSATVQSQELAKGESNLTVILLRSEEHTSELQSQFHLVCRLLLEKKKKITDH